MYEIALFQYSHNIDISISKFLWVVTQNKEDFDNGTQYYISMKNRVGHWPSHLKVKYGTTREGPTINKNVLFYK